MALCEGVNTFSGGNCTYIEWGCEALVRLFLKSFLLGFAPVTFTTRSLPIGVTSPGLVLTTRGLGKNSPGLVNANPSLVKASLSFVEAARRLVGDLSFRW